MLSFYWGEVVEAIVVGGVDAISRSFPIIPVALKRGICSIRQMISRAAQWPAKDMYE
jgi:hypothetical protein